MGFRWLLAVLWAVVAVPAWAGMEEDAAWIARAMARDDAPGVAPPAAEARRIARSELASRIGDKVRLVLDDGRERRGILEAVSGGELALRTQLPSGYFRYRVPLAAIRDALED